MQTAERESAETLLRSKGLRVTAKRVAVLRRSRMTSLSLIPSLLSMRDRNLNPATVTATLELKDAGLVRVVSRAGRYRPLCVLRAER